MHRLLPAPNRATLTSSVQHRWSGRDLEPHWSPAIRALLLEPPPVNLGLRGLQTARTTNVRRGLVQEGGWPKLISR